MYRLEFVSHQYSANRLSQLDSAWWVLYTVMTVVGKWVLVTENEQGIFDAAIVVALLLLFVKLCLPRVYAQWRAAIVFVFHLILTTLRAMAVFSMAPRQAVHWRPFRHATEVGKQDTLMFYLSTMLGTTGGSHRLLEMLGLQQSVRSNAIITCYYVAIQLFAGMHGFRMGYANGLFFLVHEGFDGVTSLVDTLLDWLVLLPTRPQATCNSCPGVSLYITVLLWSGAVMPLVPFLIAAQVYDA
ncbi:hypothetical protein OEZ86_007893 [Tetradesmus obliquus]|nr:hypothetical protein OEZ86_007893 [Tetradesmus obliquus]